LGRRSGRRSRRFEFVILVAKL